MTPFELIEFRQRHSTFWQCVRYLWRNRHEALQLTEHVTAMREMQTEGAAELSRVKEQLSRSQQEITALEDELTQSRSDCERLKAHSERLIESMLLREEKTATLNRLSAEGAAELAKLKTEIPTLQAENERLRKTSEKLFKTMVIRAGFDNERQNDAFQALSNVRK